MAPDSHKPYDPRALRAIANEYGQPDDWRAARELAITALPFIALVAAVFAAVNAGFWPGLLLVIPAGALLVRLFMIQHDCGHGTFFSRRRLNDLVGRAIGVLTLTPYTFWRRSHAIHHATSGNLDRRGIGDVNTLTVREYLSSSRWGRFFYRVYRHPLVIFGIGPTYIFLIRHRAPGGTVLREREALLSVLGTNLAIVGIVAAAAFTIGLDTLAIGYLPVSLIGASLGVWLFYVQHQYEDTYWAHEDNWDFATAAWEGSSYYDLPRPLHWLTANIGFHHIHHLCSKVPSYRLRDCFLANPAFAQARRLTLRSSLRCARLALWDEDTRKLVSFRDLPGAATA